MTYRTLHTGMLAFSLVLTLAGCAGTGSDAGATAQAAASGAQKEEKKRYCRYTEVTGSKFERRICGSAEFWAGVDAATEQQMEDVKRTIRTQSACTGNGCN